MNCWMWPSKPTLNRYPWWPKSIRTRDLGEGFVSIDLTVDVKAAMGANMMNTMLEAVADVVQVNCITQTLFSILSKMLVIKA